MLIKVHVEPFRKTTGIEWVATMKHPTIPFHDIKAYGSTEMEATLALQREYGAWKAIIDDREKLKAMARDIKVDW